MEKLLVKQNFMKLFILLILGINAFAGDIVISKDTTVNNTWNIPATTIIRFETGGKISGTGTINGGIIQAAYNQFIFDTTITVNPSSLYDGIFSARWFGMNPASTGIVNRKALQKSINTCISAFELFIPKGNYTLDSTVVIQGIYQGQFVGVGIHLFGESNFWAPERGTNLIFTNRSGNGIALQQNGRYNCQHLFDALY